MRRNAAARTSSRCPAPGGRLRRLAVRQRAIRGRRRTRRPGEQLAGAGERLAAPQRAAGDPRRITRHALWTLPRLCQNQRDLQLLERWHEGPSSLHRSERLSTNELRIAHRNQAGPRLIRDAADAGRREYLFSGKCDRNGGLHEENMLATLGDGRDAQARGGGTIWARSGRWHGRRPERSCFRSAR
jgi:hypothetical protein